MSSLDPTKNFRRVLTALATRLRESSFMLRNDPNGGRFSTLAKDTQDEYLFDKADLDAHVLETAAKPGDFDLINVQNKVSILGAIEQGHNLRYMHTRKHAIVSASSNDFKHSFSIPLLHHLRSGLTPLTGLEIDELVGS